MIKAIIAYYIISIKSLMHDVISLVWGIVFPLIVYLINRTSINSSELIIWWAYMSICSFIYGIGLYTIELRDTGCLKTFFSINPSRSALFIGELLTQITYTCATIAVFNIVVIIIDHYNPAIIVLYSFICIIASLPIAFLGFAITIFHKIHYDSLRTIVSIAIFALFISSTVERIQKYNPLYMLYKLISQHSIEIVFSYVIFSLLSILIGLYSIKKLTATSSYCR